jgi:hypothetical protein
MEERQAWGQGDDGWVSDQEYDRWIQGDRTRNSLQTERGIDDQWVKGIESRVEGIL